MQIALKRVYKLKDVIDDIHSGGTPSTKQSEYWGGNLKWLSSGETSNSFIYETVEKITEAGVKNSSTKLAKKNDVVLACAGQGKTRGQVSYLEDDMYINQSVIALTANKSILDSLYLFYNLKNRYKELRGGSDSSSTRGSITTTSLKNLYIELPPLSVQQKIVSVLHSYDKLIQNHKKQIENLQNLASELYKEWFVRFRFPGYEKATFENGIPKGWKFEKLSCICSVTDGTHDSPKSVENVGVPLVTGKSVKNGEVDFSQTYNISIEDHEKIRKRSGLKTGDILFSNIGTVGNACIVNYDREFSVKNMIIFKPTNRDISLFLYYLLINETYQNIFHAQTNGSTQQFLGLDFMRKFKILVPTQTLLSNFGQKSIDIYSQIQICRKKIENCTQQQSLLLPRLMSGKLEVK